ncbi:CRISPR-associated helicase Cas3' [Candidatus Manganitrophus noduliformans]|uniref:CRISPR-associated helicase Cas3 n=1 Tax=Candidatus Manganitrophus noduliformans TaxID=2606439 RepID=A0A7X6DUJ0_9BACT|nr:CRISPR-associated helicase Cas3' [Candidatus Manganitrophus noduliformans]NKE73666.1 CRISPR-associated helicase Cas3' [Candidatus Manganitrophus noduliformans]
MKPIYSHKLESGKFLPWIAHAQRVADRALAIVRSKQFEFPSFQREDVEDAIYLCALFHDFGKGTQYFQIYLKTAHRHDLSKAFVKAGLIANERLKDHSLLSGLCAFKVACESFSNKSKGIREQLAASIFLTCASHHGSLKSQGWVSETLTDGFENTTLEDLARMYETLDPQMFVLNFPSVSGSGRGFNAQVCEHLDFRKVAIEVRKTFTKIASTRTTFELNILTMFLYSILLESDKFWLVTGEKDSSILPYTLDERSVDVYRTQKFSNVPKTVLNDMRNMAYQEVGNTLSAITPQKVQTGGFWNLSLPTGMGKTLILADAGLKVANLMVKAGMRPKVIVALPFLSVIEQSYEEYAKILGSDNILKYHSLSDLGAGSMADGTDRDTIKFHADIWNKPFIVTTFDQLLYAFLSEKKAFASRFHNLFNAVVLLDEIQGVPYKAWTTFAEFVNLLCKIGKSHFIISSATCPDFEVPGTGHLVENPNRYYKKLKRTNLSIKKIKEPMDEDELLKFLDSLLVGHTGQSLLVILNTVRCAQKIYEELTERYLGRRVYSLTAALLPIHRAAIIAQVKEDIKNKGAPILIATQTVEAGVDLDFDATVRDIAPLDSIIQAAGRTNRNWGNPQRGVVYLVCVKSNEKLHAHAIYGRDSDGHSLEVDVTVDMLGQCKSDELEETKFLNLVQRYFNWLHTRAQKDTDAMALGQALRKLRFDLQTKTIKQMLRGEDEKTRIFLIHNQVSMELLERVKAAWESVQGERFKINQWELELLDARGGLAENTLGLYRWQFRILDINYVDSSRELFPYVDVTDNRHIYDFDIAESAGIGFRYNQSQSSPSQIIF